MNDKLILTKEGYHYISKNGIEYELLDGTSINPNGQEYTSDICFIMFIYVKKDDNDPKETISELIGWFWGSGFVGGKYVDGKFIESFEADEVIIDSVDAYENAHPKFVKMYGNVEPKGENEMVKVSVETFVKLYQAETSKFLEICEQGLDDGNSPINQDMIITWNGITCNVGNGASVSNHIVNGLENFLTEDDGVDVKDWKED